MLWQHAYVSALVVVRKWEIRMLSYYMYRACLLLFIITNKWTINITKVHVTTFSLCILYWYMFRQFRVIRQFPTNVLLKLHICCKLSYEDMTVSKHVAVQITRRVEKSFEGSPSASFPTRLKFHYKMWQSFCLSVFLSVCLSLSISEHVVPFISIILLFFTTGLILSSDKILCCSCC